MQQGRSFHRRRLAAQLAVLLVFNLLASSAFAQQTIHYFQSTALPPGAIGKGQLLRGGPLPGYFQPVEIQVPEGASVSLAVNGQFDQPQPGSALAGMLIGEVYQFKVTGIPRRPGFEVFPTIEVINRLYPPRGLKDHFPIPVEVTAEELEMALSGRFVTRVIYLEDPYNAMPLPQQDGRTFYYEVRPGEDPLKAADRLGRPMAILRMGSRVPAGANDLTHASPPIVKLAKPGPLPEPNSGLEPTPSGGTRQVVPRIPLEPKRWIPVNQHPMLRMPHAVSRPTF